MEKFQNYYQIESKAYEQGLNRLLWIARDLLIEDEREWLRAGGENTRKAKSQATKRIVEWVNAIREEVQKEKETLGAKSVSDTVDWTDFKHFTPAYLYTKAFAILLKD